MSLSEAGEAPLVDLLRSGRSDEDIERTVGVDLLDIIRVRAALAVSPRRSIAQSQRAGRAR